MKKTFEVEVKEILARKVSIEIEMNGQSEKAAKAQAIEETQRMYNNEEIVLDSNDHIETIIKQERFGNTSNISLDTLIKIIEFINENNISKEDKEEIADILNIRICSVCGKLMYKGHIIIDDYACGDECKAKLVSDEEYDNLCKSDEAYETDWV